MERLREIMDLSFFDNRVMDYVVAVLVFSGLLIVLLIAKRLVVAHLGRLAAKTSNDIDDLLVRLLSAVGWPVFTAVSLYVATMPLEMGPAMREAVRNILIVVVTIRSVFLAQELIRYGLKKKWSASRPSDPSSEAVARNLAHVLRWVLWAVATVFLLDNLGVDISTLVAGLGIGGVAVALAAQTILGDLFSAVSIFFDKPFSVGDFIIVDDMMGTVEYIGLKTTRIRSLHGELLVLSNSDLTKGRIRNYKKMEQRRIAFKIGIVYQTPAEKAKKVPALIREICAKVDGIKLDRAHFQSFGDFSLVYEVVYYVFSPDYNVYMDKQQEINFRLMETFAREGIEFAYPTQTIHLSAATTAKPV